MEVSQPIGPPLSGVRGGEGDVEEATWRALRWKDGCWEEGEGRAGCVRVCVDVQIEGEQEEGGRGALRGSDRPRENEREMEERGEGE
eukprot:1360793-Amorphochlora_amoeboformis.AAC.1